MPEQDYRGTVALITGGSDGIGADTARQMAARGAAVAVNFHTGEGKAKELVDTIVAAGGKAIAVGADVTDAEQVAAMVAETVTRLGPIDVLVLNATGLYGRDVPFLPFAQVSWSYLERTVTRQMQSLFFPLQTVLPAMIERGSGSVVAVGAALSRTPSAGLLAISMAKAALEALVKSLAREVGPMGVRVNGVGPGFILSAATAEAPEFLVQAAAERAALRRNGVPADVASAITYLASPQASYLTGSYVLVDGGTAMV
ncbi:3-oxoacyl-[acyl-carrier-protein] reductase [Paractinoplanes ferrugineus]|uniref:Beta-ketoacyl-ACP reductase n=1 Tax=Paractinoplanes ferrugineus TaxID=113564 RepID=A0A919JAU0_9ACTN|nr:SDR family oxidoreductase [Actinoplanes ferrugineus]GIE16243.1 beta-ketoacyl-ACP reductase [Actinoplanes ferrugineus]